MRVRACEVVICDSYRYIHAAEPLLLAARHASDTPELPLFALRFASTGIDPIAAANIVLTPSQHQQQQQKHIA